MKHISEIIQDILVEWAYRVHDGMPNPKNAQHIQQLRESMEELNLPNKVIYQVIQNLINEQDDEDEKVTFKHDGETRTITMKTARQYASDIKQGKSTDEKQAAVKAAGLSDKGDTKQDKEKKEPKQVDFKSTDDYLGSKDDEKSDKGVETKEKGDSESKQNHIKNGFVKGAAPGNAGSMYNEIMSGEVSDLLQDNPNATEEELVKSILDKYGDSNLARQNS